MGDKNGRTRLCLSFLTSFSGFLRQNPQESSSFSSRRRQASLTGSTKAPLKLFLFTVDVSESAKPERKSFCSSSIYRRNETFLISFFFLYICREESISRKSPVRISPFCFTIYRLKNFLSDFSREEIFFFSSIYRRAEGNFRNFVLLSIYSSREGRKSQIRNFLFLFCDLSIYKAGRKNF